MIATLALLIPVTSRFCASSLRRRIRRQGSGHAEGTVTKVEWGNPHCHDYADVTDRTATPEKWGFEAAGPALMEIKAEARYVQSRR
jgi:hypothetical protein